jgi:hypothetical protein
MTIIESFKEAIAMNFIDKANEIDAARRVLGVGRSATPNEIRSAWKQMAFDTHPDRNGGDDKAFAHAKAAYALLETEGYGSNPRKDGGAHMSEIISQLRRSTSIELRVETLSETALADCQDALSACARDAEHAPHVAVFDLDSDAASRSQSDLTDHVPKGVERQGRKVVFLVTTTPRKGRNRVVIPTALLKDKRKTEPKIFVFDADMMHAAELLIPDPIASQALPGVRDLRVRFGDM